MAWIRPYDQQAESVDGYVTVDLEIKERDVLLGMLERNRRPPVALRKYLAKKLTDAPRHSGKPLPPATLDWSLAEREALRRGESVPEWLFDQPF